MTDTRKIKHRDSKEQQEKQKQDYHGNRDVLSREITHIGQAVMSVSRDAQHASITPRTKHSALEPRLDRDYMLPRRYVLGTYIVRPGRSN